jgi:hypothetical protein
MQSPRASATLRRRVSRTALPALFLEQLEPRQLLSAVLSSQPIGTVTPPVVTITASHPRASETAGAGAAGTGAFTFSRTGDKSAALLVTYAIAGTADADDTAPLSGTIEIPAGSSKFVLSFRPVDDAIAEDAETVIATLQPSADYTVGPKNAATVTISDNEPLVTIARLHAASEADPTGKGRGQFVVSRKGSTAADLVVSYTTAGTAGAGDYAAMTGTVTILAGQTKAAIDLVPVSDTLLESAESVIVTLSPDAAYHLPAPAKQSATVTIANSLAVDFLAAAELTNTGSSWNYVSKSAGNTGAGTETVTALSASSWHQVMSVSGGNIDPSSETINWSLADGMVKMLTHAATTSGITGGSVFTDLTVCPQILTTTPYIDSAPVVYLLSPYGGGNGTSTVTTKLLGTQTITVPAGTFTAVKVSISIKTSVPGTITVNGVHLPTQFTETDNNTLWIVAGVGVVKYTTSASIKAVIQGHGTQSGSVNVTAQLSTYTLAS